MSAAAHAAWVGEMELSSPGTVMPVGPDIRIGYRHGRILIRLHGVPMGFIELPFPDGRVDPATVLRKAWRHLGAPIHLHLMRDGLPLPDEGDSTGLTERESCREVAETSWHEPLTVVVCSRDHPAQLAMCLSRLQTLRYATFEVIVVDNAPSNNDSATCFTNAVGVDPRFRYVIEPRPGLSRARNRGMAEASYAHVAFTDDDVLVDPWWLDGVARGFSRDPNAGCVTGLVPSARLDTPSERYFDQRVWWSSRFEAHVYNLSNRAGESRLFPFDAGKIGTGANFAVDRDLIERIGGFDEALGAGSPTRGGEDLDMFVRVLRADRTIVYEPSAMVWHLHRAGFEELRRHLVGYGMGLSAYVTKYLADVTTRGELLRRVPAGVAHMLRLWGRADPGVGMHTSFVLAEARGIAAGPFAYWRARRSGWSRPG